MKNALSNSDYARLDKWLWAARFFKTRALATEAVSRGNVRVNGNRSKPGRRLRINDELEIKKGPYQWAIIVLALSETRGPASVASKLYAEAEDSIGNREQVRNHLQLDRLSKPLQQGKPTKKDRREARDLKKRY